MDRPGHAPAPPAVAMGPRRPRAAPPLDSILEAVGGTPIVRLGRVIPAGAAAIYAKLESFNPGGSVKDRIALAMIEAAEREGRLAPGGRLVEPTTGNTGVGLALVCAVKGYRLTLVLPDSTALEHLQALEAYGAEIVLTRAEEGLSASVARALELARRDGALVLDQFANPANPDAHRRGTGPELVQALRTGVAPVLRHARPGVLVVAVEPEACAVLSGGRAGPTRIQGLGAGFVPAVLDRGAYDRVVTVSDEEAWAMKARLAREEGLLVGISSGAAVAAAVRVARELGDGKVVATVLGDTGERYFSMEEWFGPGADAPARKGTP